MRQPRAVEMLFGPGTMRRACGSPAQLYGTMSTAAAMGHEWLAASQGPLACFSHARQTKTVLLEANPVHSRWAFSSLVRAFRWDQCPARKVRSTCLPRAMDA